MTMKTKTIKVKKAGEVALKSETFNKQYLCRYLQCGQIISGWLSFNSFGSAVDTADTILLYQMDDALAIADNYLSYDSKKANHT